MRSYRLLPQSVLLIGTLLFCAGLIAVPMACTANQRQTAIRSSVVAVSSARVAWLAWDLKHQRDLVADATSKEDAQTRVTTYRARQADVERAFILAFQGLALASTASDDPSLKAALASADQVMGLLKTLGVSL